MNAFKQTEIELMHAKQRLWNVVWRSAFMILGDEDKAKKIADEATDPSAIKDDVIVPDVISAPNKEAWACVYKAALANCGDSEQAIMIANDVGSSSDINLDNGTKQVVAEKDISTPTVSKSIAVSNAGGLIVQKTGGTLGLAPAIKSADNNSPEEGWVEGYLVSWGSNKDTDLQGEFFSPRTEFCLDWFGERPVLYHHGMDDSTGLKKIGVFKSIKVDDIGLWVQAQLDMRDRYARAVYDMVAAKQFGWSSGSVDHLVKIGENGEILVWPLIEGSITPTPAQPAKTAVRPIKSLTGSTTNSYMTMQAFKAVLSGDAKSSEYLRGLDERIEAAEKRALNEITQARVATQKTLATGTQNNNVFIEGEFKSMARNTDSAWYITRAVAKAFGIKDASPEELAAVASEVQGVVNDEVTLAAAQALEDEAQVAVAQDQVAATASYNRNRQNRGQAYRQVVPEATMQDSEAVQQDQLPATMQDPATVASYRRAMRQAQLEQAAIQQAQVVPATMQAPVLPATMQMPVAPATMQDPVAADIEEAMMQEIAAQMEEDQFEQKAARALRRRAWNRAMRQIADTPDATAQYEATMQDVVPATMQAPVAPATMQAPVDPATMQDPATIASYLARRNFASRQAAVQDPVMSAVMADEESVQSDPAATMSEDIITDVAQASFRRGFRSGIQNAYRQVDPAAVMADPEAIQQDQAAAEDAAVASEVDQISATASDDVVDQAARAYRAGYRRGLRRAVRQLELDTQSEEASAADEETPAAAAASYRRAMRQAQIDAAVQQDEASAQDLQPIVPPGTIASYGQRGYGYRQVGDPAAVMQDQFVPIAADEALLSEDAMMQDATFAEDPAIAQYLEATQQDSILPPASVASYGRSQRGYGYRQLDPSLPVAPATMQDQFTPAMMADEMAAMQQDQNFAIEQDQSIDELGVTPVRTANYNQQAYRSASGFDGGNAYEAQRQAEFWRRRAQELESVEAPNQRAFKSLGVKDVADRPGAYTAAFKSYLMKGLGMMTETEKYVLSGKGKARWENASFSYDTSTKSVKTYASGSDASAGFLVPEDWVNELNKNVMTQTVMAPECKTRTTTSDRIVQPNLNTTDARRAHPAQVRWPGESPASNADHRTVEDDYTQVTIPIHVMLITLAATNSALEDATFNLEEEINEAFAEAVAVSYDQLIWGGDGQGKLQGIVTNNQVVGSPSLGMKTVGGYVATGNADGIVTADTLKTMLFHLPQGYRQRAKWYMNSNTALQVATLKDGQGNYLIDQRDDALRTVGVPDRLLNKPIVFNEWADDADSGNFPIVLADLTRGYIIGRRVEFSIRRFDDSNYAEHDQVLFLGRARLGGQVLQPAAFKALKVALS